MRNIISEDGKWLKKNGDNIMVIELKILENGYFMKGEDLKTKQKPQKSPIKLYCNDFFM